MREQADRPTIPPWVRRLYAAISALALIGLVATTVSAAIGERRMRESDAQQLATYFSGAAQWTSRAVEAVKDESPPATVRERLSLAATASRELSVSLLWYNRRHESTISPSTATMYADELNGILLQLGANGSISPADRGLLEEIAHDLSLLQQLCSEEVLRRSRPTELATLRLRLTEELHHAGARKLVHP